MPDDKRKSYAHQLMETVRQHLRNDMAGPYTTLSPKLRSDGVMVMQVKDRRHSGIIELTARKVPES